MKRSEGNERKAKLIKLAFGMVLVAVFVLLLLIQIPSFFTSSGLSQQNACINNLRQIDGAKRSWALEHNANRGDIVTSNDVALYVNPKFLDCPAAGNYSFGRVGESPTCSIAGHALPP